MGWRVEIWEACCNYERRKRSLRLFMKPKLSHRLGEHIYIYAISPSGKKKIPVVLTLEEAKRLAREIEEHMDTHRRVKQLIACWKLNEMFEKIEE